MDAAEMLGLTAATPDGVVALLQLPPLVPSVALFEAAERAALETPTSESQPLPDGIKPKPKFHKGPELLKALPSGRVRSPCSLRLSAAGWLMLVASELSLHLFGNGAGTTMGYTRGQGTEAGRAHAYSLSVCVCHGGICVAVCVRIRSVVWLPMCSLSRCLHAICTAMWLPENRESL